MLIGYGFILTALAAKRRAKLPILPPLLSRTPIVASDASFALAFFVTLCGHPLRMEFAQGAQKFSQLLVAISAFFCGNKSA
jgi:hypothetical protein